MSLRRARSCLALSQNTVLPLSSLYVCLYLGPLAALAPAGIKPSVEATPFLSEDGRLIFKKPDDVLVSCAELSSSVLEGERGGQSKKVGRKGLPVSLLVS